MDIPLSKSDYFRGVAKEARIRTRNRYFEQNPILTGKGSAMLARMGMARLQFIGQGGIQGIYSQPGSFNDAAFVASGGSLWRYDKNGTKTLIGSIGMSSPNNAVIMAATAYIGTTPEYLFCCGGGQLNLYMSNGYAIGTLTGTPANGNVVQIGGIYYQFTNGSVNAGSPAGTAGSPWLVAVSTSSTAAFQNLSDALGNQGIAGTAYR